MTELETKIIFYLHRAGPTYANKIAELMRIERADAKQIMKKLEQEKMVRRVTKTFVDYHVDAKNKVTKHRNHTYFETTKQAKEYLRGLDEMPQVSLRPPFKRSSQSRR